MSWKYWIVMDYGKKKKISDEIRPFDWIKLIHINCSMPINSLILADSMIWLITHNSKKENTVGKPG